MCGLAKAPLVPTLALSGGHIIDMASFHFAVLCYMLYGKGSDASSIAMPKSAAARFEKEGL